MSPVWSLRIGSRRGGRDVLLTKPVLPAAGFLGYGRGYPGILDPQALGAVVTRTTTLSPRTATASTVRTRGGFILPLPPSNPGLTAVLRQFGPGWVHSPVPAILSVYVDGPEEMAAIGRRLEAEPGLAGVELAVPMEIDAKWLANVAAALAEECDLPLLVRLPLPLHPELIPAAVEQGVAGLVVATPHRGRTGPSGLAGPVYGPATLPYTLDAVAQAADLAAGTPVFALGGIYAKEDAAACARAGAAAIQLDGLLMLDPAGAGRLAAELSAGWGEPTASA